MVRTVEAAVKVPGLVLDDHVIPARGSYALRMRRDQILRVIEIEGRQVMDLVAFRADDFTEKLSMVWTNVINGTWKVTKGHTLYTNLSAPMFRILEDTVAMNYSGGGFCTEQANFQRYGVRDTPNCANNLMHALAPHGIERRDLAESACLNLFMNVAYEPDGTLEIRLPTSQSGDYMDLEAQMDVLVGMSCCPQERNPANAFRPTPLRVLLHGG
jgi:uncharacterized protein YcgI (DUF1989 family)